MLLTVLLLLYFRCRSVTAYLYAKPAEKTIWPERCSRGQRIINDCNWCVCNNHMRFTCQARVCSGVDHFGHFNDAIQDYEVGMEGHGVWRSGPTQQSACAPNMHYQREGLLCVCNDSGNWPSPVCRDLFQVMHEVELTGHDRPSALHRCERDKLYLYGCNVCFCPISGRIDPEVCTKNNCTNDDPILKSEKEIELSNQKFEEAEVYAECDLNRKYAVGCRKCICLKNNRLLCDNCEKDEIYSIARASEEKDHCKMNNIGEVFSIDCNVCLCDQKGLMYCTTRRCVHEPVNSALTLNETSDLSLRSVDPPMDPSECIPGTKYKIDCNTCICAIEKNIVKKFLVCDMRDCDAPVSSVGKATDKEKKKKKISLKSIINTCVDNTVYQSNCLLCRCDVVEGVTRESCLTASRCAVQPHAHSPHPGRGAGAAAGAGPSLFDLHLSHGYCEPLHLYKWDCNTCKCLTDGKTVACSSHVCPPADAAAAAVASIVGERAPELPPPLTVDVVPVTAAGGSPCPRDHVYRVDCNVCFCLSNGNLLCTTVNCDTR